CIACHGGVRRKAGFSLLFRDDALAATESGKPAITPGNASGSELIRRISSNDPEERMPYRHEPLSGDEIKILSNWIEQGAEWGQHWAYTPVRDVKPPQGDKAWFQNDIDKFILARIREAGLRPAVEADKRTLLR